MEIIFVREAQNRTDILSQVKNSIIARIQQAVNIADRETESLILPIIPKNNPFKHSSKIDNYKGLTTDYNVPSHEDLRSFEWSSIFPVNKNYSFQHAGSNINGFDYVDFIEERQNNRLPFRLIAYDYNTITSTIMNEAGMVLSGSVNVQNIAQNAIRIFFDGFVTVKEFDYYIDNAKDINYSLKLEEFNSETLMPEIDWASSAVNIGSNVVTKYALQKIGLI